MLPGLHEEGHFYEENFFCISYFSVVFNME
jgi:hypothetical protein